MRTLWILLLGCAAGACGGNFSNDDLEFLNALPAREDLTARVPGNEALSGASGPGQLVGPLAVGELSEIYRNTHEASNTFNSGLDGLLSLLEHVRGLPPTTRTHDRRVWGPAKLDRPAGHELRFTMTRTDDVFDYQLQVRRTGSGEEGWWSFLNGFFQADGGLRRGTGELHLQTGAALSRGFDLGGLSGQKRLDIVYQTRALPLSVEMNFVSALVAPDLRYTYRKLPSGLGEMTFLIQGANVVPGRRKEDLSIISRWTKEGSGSAHIVVMGGDVPEGFDAIHVECWNARFQVTYHQRSWETTTEGSASACPDVSELER